MSKIKPDRKGSRIGKTAQTICYVLAAVLAIDAVWTLIEDSESPAAITAIVAAVAFALLGMLFYVLSGIAANLETIAAVAMIDNEEEIIQRVQ